LPNTACAGQCSHSCAKRIATQGPPRGAHPRRPARATARGCGACRRGRPGACRSLAVSAPATLSQSGRRLPRLQTARDVLEAVDSAGSTLVLDNVGFHPDAEAVRVAGCKWRQDVRQQLLRGHRADDTVWTSLCPAVPISAVLLCPAVFGRDVDRALSVLQGRPRRPSIVDASSRFLRVARRPAEPWQRMGSLRDASMSGRRQPGDRQWAPLTAQAAILVTGGR
jgi:hypothetical protein